MALYFLTVRSPFILRICELKQLCKFFYGFPGPRTFSGPLGSGSPVNQRNVIKSRIKMFNVLMSTRSPK